MKVTILKVRNTVPGFCSEQSGGIYGLLTATTVLMNGLLRSSTVIYAITRVSVTLIGL